MKFDVIQNDITNMNVNAVVLPANEKLKEGSGTSKAIFQKAGRKELTKACNTIGTCKVGDAVPTRAFKLEADYIIHAVVPKWIDGNHQEYEYLSAAYLSALNIADIMKCESIAFPLLASGNNGFDLGLAYDIAKTSIEMYEGTYLKEVVLVLYGEDIATFMKGKGVTVIDTKETTQSIKKKEHVLKLKKIGADGKQLAAKILEEQLEKAIEYLKDEKNREKVIEHGKKIAKFAIEMARKAK